MGEFSIYHWLVVVFVILLLFGGRKIPELMKGMGEGIRSFKDGMGGKSSTITPPTQQIGNRPDSGTDSANQKT